jgi:hypothetical protein
MIEYPRGPECSVILLSEPTALTYFLASAVLGEEPIRKLKFVDDKDFDKLYFFKLLNLCSL